MKCWNCHQELSGLPHPLPFKSTCDHCLAWQHVCVNCIHYAPGLPNSCRMPYTEPVTNREGYNLCEEFRRKIEAKNDPVTDVRSVEEKLFGNSSEDTSSKSFDDLFKS